MPDGVETESRKLLGRLREAMASEAAGQERLDHITHIIANSMGTEVCSIYLFRDEETLELCATEGLNAEAVKGRRTVQQNWSLLNYLFESTPDLWA